MDKTKLFVLEKVKAELSESPYEAILISGADHIQYLSGAVLPGMFSNTAEPVYFYLAIEAEPVLVCASKWKATLLHLGWVKQIETYELVENPFKMLEKLLKGKGPLGVDLERMPVSVYQQLAQIKPEGSLLPCDPWLKTLRMSKTSAELSLLADIAARTDHGIAGAIHHVPVLGARSEKYIAEDIRVHCIEREMDCQGYHSLSLAASGEHSQKIWPLAPGYGMGWAKPLLPEDTVRLEMRPVMHGYWGEAARMLIMGPPDEHQNEAYQGLVSLRKDFESALKPGIKAHELFTFICRQADEKHIRLIETCGIGHGIGVTPYEGPFINAWDETILCAGMVVVLDLLVQSRAFELFRIRETYFLNQAGFSRADWYQAWDEPYVPAYTF